MSGGWPVAGVIKCQETDLKQSGRFPLMSVFAPGERWSDEAIEGKGILTSKNEEDMR